MCTVRDGCRFHGGKEGSGGRLGGCLPWDDCSTEHSPTCPSAPRSTCVGAWGWVTTAVSGKLCIYAVSTLLLIQPFVFQVVEKTFVCRVLRDDWIANAVLFCLFIKHRALVCHEMTEISLLMRIQGNKESFTSSKCSGSCWVHCSSTCPSGYSCKVQ